MLVGLPVLPGVLLRRASVLTSVDVLLGRVASFVGRAVQVLHQNELVLGGHVTRTNNLLLRHGSSLFLVGIRPVDLLPGSGILSLGAP